MIGGRERRHLGNIGARNECVVVAGEHDRTHRRVRVGLGQRLGQQGFRVEIQSVSLVRSVDPDHLNPGMRAREVLGQNGFPGHLRYLPVGSMPTFRLGLCLNMVRVVQAVFPAI
jgi:hypothetical protein